METDAYLQRIGYRGPLVTTAETLRRLHRAHLFAVPFENLDIALGHPIALALPAFHDKIVRRRRGGFCYELNGLFGWLLEQLGFSVKLLSARVFNEGQAGPDFDHLLLLIELEERWIADVGFGDSFLEPLRLDAGAEVVQQLNAYRLTESDSSWVLQRRRADWEPQYVFSLQPRRLEEFNARCGYQQTSPESIFTRKTVCSRSTPEGRITLANGRLITTVGARREERVVASEQEIRALLQHHFGIDFGDGARLDRLLPPTSTARSGNELSGS